jgi:hypothetical protein
VQRSVALRSAQDEGRGPGSSQSSCAGRPDLEHFPEKHALAKAGVVTGFPSENATTQEDWSAFRVT